MRFDSPRWEQLNPSGFAHEQEGLRELASYLPDADPYHVWANVEFVGTDSSINEVDALVLTPGGLVVLELKHWQGEIAGDGTQWVRRMPNGRLVPEDNPYILANRKAKRLASVIRRYAPRGAETPYVGAAVFLHARNLRSKLDAIGQQNIYGLEGVFTGLSSPLKQFLVNRPQNPLYLIDADRGRQIIELVRGAKIKPSVADRKVGQLILYNRPFAEGIGWQDFLAGHMADTNLVRRVRFYLTSRAPEEEVPVIRRGAEREFRLLQGIHHPGIAAALDLVDHPLGPAVVFDHDKDSVRLGQWLTQRQDKLTMAQRLQLVQDLAEIVDYAHSRRLIHRALHPRAVFVAQPTSGRVNLVITDWQTGRRLSTGHELTRLSATRDSTGLELFFDDEIRCYQAPEAGRPSGVSGVKLDVFSLGAVAYRIFADQAPATAPEELAALVRDSGLNLAAVIDGVPSSLATLIYDATRGDPTQRLLSVSAFRNRLEAVWDELTAAEPEPLIDPLEARRGDVLENGLTVIRRLGSGATATALLVNAHRPEGSSEFVLKVARDEQHAPRLESEAQVLRQLKHWQVATLVEGPIRVGGRTALLLESAGPHTLAEDLNDGRLALDLLERYGRDLLEIVAFLDGQGAWHRDLKPANLAARPRPKDKQPHLCAFDFSLAQAPADQLTAGTPPYLDPFLGPPDRLRYDAAAERFAAAVTLYEMATGGQPQWGDNANPAAVSDEVTLDPASFDLAVADRMVEFFGRALARDAVERFHTAEEMSDAWRGIFHDIPQSSPQAAVHGPARSTLGRGSPIDATELTARARSALERLGVTTVGQLLDYEPSALTRIKGTPDATRKEILAQARTLRGLLPAPEADADTGPPVRGVEAVCALLLPARNSRNANELDALRVLLGQVPTAEGSYLRWPTVTEAARAAGRVPQQLADWLTKRIATTWKTSHPLAEVRTELVALLDGRGGVMSADELAAALIVARGSYTPEPGRTPQALGLVRAAVEVELARGGDARVATFRFTDAETDTVLVGREPDDPAALTTAEDLLGYAAGLGRRAGRLAALDPLPSRQQALDELRVERLPDGLQPVSDTRLLQLAVAASSGIADVNAQGQLYPVGMPGERALRLARASLLVAKGKRLALGDVQARIRARFPRAAPLPDRPDLDDLLTRHARLVWHREEHAYLPKQDFSSAVHSGNIPSYLPSATLDAAGEADVKLATVLRNQGFLAVMAPLRHAEAVRHQLLASYPLTEVNVTAILVDQLRAQDFPWDVIVAADTGQPTDPDFRSLLDLVRHEVVPALRAVLDAEAGPVLLTEAGPLARYGQLQLLQELADLSRPRPAARLLLVAARRPEPALLDQIQLPLTAPAAQSLWMPETWLEQTLTG